MRVMIHRELSTREKEMLLMIRPTTFQDIVDAVRREVDNNRYNARRELRILKNNGTNGNSENNNGNNRNNEGHDTDLDIREN